MHIRSTGVTLALCVLGAVVALAADPQIGSWKLNEAKSKITGMAKNNLVVYSMAGDNVKVAIDGQDGTGKAFHSEWTGKFDGKDYAVTGDPSSDMRAYKKIDDHTLSFVSKKGGKVTLSGKVVVAADGQSRTVTASGKDAAGNATTNTTVYDKQ